MEKELGDFIINYTNHGDSGHVMVFIKDNGDLKRISGYEFFKKDNDYIVNQVYLDSEKLPLTVYEELKRLLPQSITDKLPHSN